VVSSDYVDILAMFKFSDSGKIQSTTKQSFGRCIKFFNGNISLITINLLTCSVKALIRQT